MKSITIKKIGTKDYGLFFQELSELVGEHCYSFQIDIGSDFIKMNQENIDNLKEAGRLIFDAVNDLDAQRAIAELEDKQ